MQSFEEILLDIKKTKTEYERLCDLQSFQEILLDKKLFLNIKKQTEIIKPLIDSYENFLEEKENLDIITTLLKNNESDKEINEEFLTTQNKLNDCEEKLKKNYYLLKSNLENISIEIVENKGEISNKLCEILLQGYCNFCKQNCFNFKVINQDVGANINISGYGVKSYFEDEIGLQNVVLGTKSGSCCVFMYKSINNQSFNFSEEELKITTCRSSGAGGQHINTTDSSIKIVHLPTGITAVSQDERSQLQNKQKALERLKKKVTDFLENKNKNEIEKQKKEQLKLMKVAVKTYNLETKQVVSLKQKKQIFLSNFLNGKTLN